MAATRAPGSVGPVARFPKAAEIVADGLRSSIADGTHRAGDALAPQAELAELYGVSQPTMREALRILETEGLIEIRRGVHGGVFVSELDVTRLSRVLGTYLRLAGATIGDIATTRLALEPLAARLVAESAARRRAGALRECLDALQLAGADVDAVAAAGAELHLRLFELCPSPTLNAIGRLINDVVRLQIHQQVRTVGGHRGLAKIVDRAVADYGRAIASIEAGDADAAEAAWRHILERHAAFVPVAVRAAPLS